MSFLSGSLDSRITFTRASTATDLLYTATSGTYNTLATDTPRLLSAGLLIEGQRTQRLGVTDTPATQTTGSLGTGTYCYWCIGSGSVAVTAGTATITGGGSASQGVFKTFTVTGAGTVTATVTGSLSRFQLENGSFPSSYIPNAGASGTSVTRAIDLPTIPIAKFAYSSLGGTLGAKFMCGPGAAVSLGMGVMVSLHKGDFTGNNVIMLDGTNGTPQRIGFTFSSGGVFYLNNTTSGSATLSEGAVSAGIIGWNTDTAIILSSGATLTGNNSTTLPQAATQLDLGQRSGSTPMFGFLQQVDYWNTRISNPAITAYVQ